MAKFFEKINEIMLKKDGEIINDKQTTGDMPKHTPSFDVEKQVYEENNKEQEDNLSAINEFEGLTKEKAKQNIEKEIRDKLSNVSCNDEQFDKIQIEREKERAEFRATSSKRKHRDTKKNKGKNTVEATSQTLPEPIIPIVETPKTDVNTEEPLIPEEAIVEVFEKVVAAEEEKKGETKEAKENESDKKHPIKEIINQYDYLTDKIYAIIGLPIKRLFVWIKGKVIVGRERFFEKKPEAKEKSEERKIMILQRVKEIKDNFIVREKETARRMIHLINRVDHKNDEIAEKAQEAAVESGKKFNFAREWAEINKKRLLMYFAGIILLAIVGTSAFNLATAYEYSYNGRTLGLVKNQEDILRIVDLVSEQLSQEHNAEIKIDKEQDIAFKRVFCVGKDIDTMENVLRRLTYMQNMTAKGYGIYIDKKRVAIVDSKETAESVLAAVSRQYMSQNTVTKYEDVGFVESVEIAKVNTKLGRIENFNDVVFKMQTGAEKIKTHTVQAGETFSGVAKLYNITMADLKVSNPTVTPEKLSIGQQLVLTQAAPLLTVKTVEITTYIAEMPFETIYENSNSMYEGESATKVQGVSGEKQVTSKIVRNNGVQVAETVLNSSVLKTPISAVVYAGTKKMPLKQGTGTFQYPVTGARLTSKFGGRWGRMHNGIDLACPKGTKIRASDGGTVTFAGYSGSYGYMVKINHGGGFQTVYAHCSKLLVKAGEKVYQGQHIANVGSTGRSTGPHCHFEVQYLGTPKNPLNYI